MIYREIGLNHCVAHCKKGWREFLWSYTHTHPHTGTQTLLLIFDVFVFTLHYVYYIICSCLNETTKFRLGVLLGAVCMFIKTYFCEWKILLTYICSFLTTPFSFQPRTDEMGSCVWGWQRDTVYSTFTPIHDTHKQTCVCYEWQEVTSITENTHTHSLTHRATRMQQRRRDVCFRRAIVLLLLLYCWFDFNRTVWKVFWSFSKFVFVCALRHTNYTQWHGVSARGLNKKGNSKQNLLHEGTHIRFCFVDISSRMHGAEPSQRNTEHQHGLT